MSFLEVLIIIATVLWHFDINFVSIQCYSAKVLFEIFNIKSTGLNPRKFEEICPAIVEQIESKACLAEGNEEEKKEVKQGKAQGN